jgi:hypothetical protein
VVLADREHLEPELVGEACFLEQLAHPLLRTDAGCQVGESDETEVHGIPQRS